MTKLAAPLVGRARELEVLERTLAAACEGLARVLALSGEPGIGKTRLLQELARKADSHGCLVLEGRAAEFERELPFGVLLDACDEYLESLDGLTAERLAGDGLAELATVFPSLRSLVPDAAPVALAHERYRAHRAVREMLERLAKRQPVVLLLDDLHWADDASIELISHLLRRPPRAGVAVASAYRSGQAPSLLARAVDSLTAQAGLERIELGPLGPDETERLVQNLDASQRRRLYRESGGNPFYFEQLARAPGRAGDAEHEARLAGNGSGAPPAVIAAISQELHDLPAQARTLAQAAAVAGDPFEIDVAAQIAGVGEADALASLDELLARGLARPTEVPRRFRFRHPLVRRAIYESCGAGWRLGAHGRAARALGDRGASAAQRAHHVAAAALPGDVEALAILNQAAQAVAARAPATAARWYAAALRLVPDGARDDGTRLELLAGLGTSLGAAGRLAESHAALLQALDVLPDEEFEQRVRLLEMCVSIEQVMGRHISARERVVRALANIPAIDSPEAVRLRIALATTSIYGNDFDRMRDEAAVALTAATKLSDTALQAYARAILAFGAYRGSQIDEARRELGRAAADSARLADAQLAGVGPLAFVAMGSLSRSLERFEEADGLLKRGIEVSRLSGRGEFLLPLLGARATTAAALGRVAEAMALSEDALEAARLYPSSLAEMMALRSRSWTAYVGGDLTAALTAGELSQELMDAVDASHLSGSVPLGLAAALLERGEERRAMRLIIDSGRGPELAGSLLAERSLCYELLVRAALNLGHPAEARDWAERADAVARETGLPVTTCYARRARAAVLLASDDATGAAAAALDAAQAADAAGARIEGARSRTLAGKALNAAGERDRAIAELESAEIVLADCGAERFHQEAARELRRLGRRASPRTRRGRADAAGIESLSGRELEVALLVVDRKTNPEIAADLFLSKKTVESHLRNIFRKLDVSSRVELARAIERASAS
jgi:DNA-binding NarL/FixJ family response regulator